MPDYVFTVETRLTDGTVMTDKFTTPGRFYAEAHAAAIVDAAEWYLTATDVSAYLDPVDNTPPLPVPDRVDVDAVEPESEDPTTV